MKFNLDRFKSAQDNCFERVLAEMKNGKKESHWMWFVFPQIAGLGNSEVSKKYAIINLEEAEYYLMDELLSTRLIELTKILAYNVEGKSAKEIFGFPDFLKFHSCMTLFHLVVSSKRKFQTNKDFLCFQDAIQKYFKGNLDTLTMNLLKEYLLD